MYAQWRTRSSGLGSVSGLSQAGDVVVDCLGEGKRESLTMGSGKQTEWGG